MTRLIIIASDARGYFSRAKSLGTNEVKRNPQVGLLLRGYIKEIIASMKPTTAAIKISKP
ncbi:MAG: hypothetical protein EXS68_02355 [Candidatus Ryanbacteria bacterium]|nr:hypothetical protein [Candidatus Ryanbacteria bacterium]